MKGHSDRPQIRFWEYIVYVAVTMFFLFAGLMLLLLALLTGSIGNMGRLKSYVITIIALLVAVAGWATFTYHRTIDQGQNVVSIIVEPGDSFHTIVDEIVSRGVVTSKTMLTYPARLLKVDRRLTPGRYDFTGENSCRSVLRKLRNAHFVRIKATVPEGAAIWDVASILARKLDLDSADIASLNSDSAFLATVDLPCLEGYLFPETYFFPWGASGAEALTEMVRMYHAKTDSIWPDSLPAGMDRRDVITLASIIEAETNLEPEYRLVASVYVNRLRKNMKLDADPTVIYGLGGLERPLYRRDLKKDTPYNTYMHKGLPPTPINSPGLTSIKAALNPRETDYLFFVADNTGGHLFSRTNAEHNKAKRKIRTARKTDN